MSGLMMMAQCQLIKGNDVNNISVLLLKELNVYSPRIGVPKQHHKHTSLTAAHLNEVRVCINLWNSFCPGREIVLSVYES